MALKNVLRLLPALLVVITAASLCSCGTASKSRRSETNTGTPSAHGSSSSLSHALKGLASWYGKRFDGRKTASGERYNMNAMTAAHRTLPFGSRVRVVSQNGKSVIVRINDRGPFAKDRVIDLSRKAALELGVLAAGLMPVELEILPQDH